MTCTRHVKVWQVMYERLEVRCATVFVNKPGPPVAISWSPADRGAPLRSENRLTTFSREAVHARRTQPPIKPWYSASGTTTHVAGTPSRELQMERQVEGRRDFLGNFSTFREIVSSSREIWIFNHFFIFYFSFNSSTLKSLLKFSSTRNCRYIISSYT